MVILIRKRHVHVLILFLCLFCCMAAILWSGQQEYAAAMADINTPYQSQFIIDAGHGGEDGGAVAADGTPESRLNLEIALRLNDLMHFYGLETLMIRSEDISVSTPGLSTFRQRKTSDLKNRTATVNRTENGILISIHQNSLPSVPSVHGAQVFYNTVSGADDLAERIQSAFNTTINAEKPKNTRQIPDSIYLMHHSQAPAVLVECGFLSNSAETLQLKSSAHQCKIVLSILSGVLTFV